MSIQQRYPGPHPDLPTGLKRDPSIFKVGSFSLTPTVIWLVIFSMYLLLLFFDVADTLSGDPPSTAQIIWHTAAGAMYLFLAAQSKFFRNQQLWEMRDTPWQKALGGDKKIAVDATIFHLQSRAWERAYEKFESKHPHQMTRPVSELQLDVDLRYLPVLLDDQHTLLDIQSFSLSLSELSRMNQHHFPPGSLKKVSPHLTEAEIHNSCALAVESA